MNVDDLTLLGAIVVWIAMFAITFWVGVPRQNDSDV